MTSESEGKNGAVRAQDVLSSMSSATSDGSVASMQAVPGSVAAGAGISSSSTGYNRSMSEGYKSDAFSSSSTGYITPASKYVSPPVFGRILSPDTSSMVYKQDSVAPLLGPQSILPLQSGASSSSSSSGALHSLYLGPQQFATCPGIYHSAPIKGTTATKPESAEARTQPYEYEPAFIRRHIRSLMKHYQVKACCLALENRTSGNPMIHLQSCCGLSRQVVNCSSITQHISGRQLPIIIGDASEHERVKKDPLVVRHPFTRFYAGAPIIMGVSNYVGCVCIMDPEPRHDVDLAECQFLVSAAAAISKHLENYMKFCSLRQQTLETLPSMDGSEDDDPDI